MEWVTGVNEGENLEVDIGFVPQMEIKLTAPSIPVPEGEDHLRDFQIYPNPEKAENVEDIKWTEEISFKQAIRNLEVEMYPFKKVGI